MSWLEYMINLVLGRNHIGDEGAIALCDKLQANKTLTTLNLGTLLVWVLAYNNIHREGSRAIAALIKANNELADLNIGITLTKPKDIIKSVTLEQKLSQQNFNATLYSKL